MTINTISLSSQNTQCVMFNPENIVTQKDAERKEESEEAELLQGCKAKQKSAGGEETKQYNKHNNDITE